MNSMKWIGIFTCVAAIGGGSAQAEIGHHRKHRTANLATMNLTPRTVLARPIAEPKFAPDTTPTSIHYNLPTEGMGGVVGYKPFVDPHPIPGYEVNQATALGFSQPSATVGASVGVKF